MIRRAVLSILCAFFVLAPTCQQPSSRVTWLGTAGLFPSGATFSNGTIVATPEQWTKFWTGAKASGEQIGIHSPLVGVEGAMQGALQQGIPVVVVTDIPADAASAAQDAEVSASLAQRYPSIRAWCVGNEVDNRSDLAQASVWANTVLDAIEAARPEIITCTVFQYERSKGLSNAVSLWSLFHGDALGITTYPQAMMGYANAGAVPSNHYSTLNTWATSLKKKTLVTEVGWSASNESDQNAWLQKFLQIGPQSAVLANWFSLYDFTGYPQATFAKMGLYRGDGSARPIVATWKQALAVPKS